MTEVVAQYRAFSFLLAKESDFMIFCRCRRDCCHVNEPLWPSEGAFRLNDPLDIAAVRRKLSFLRHLARSSRNSALFGPSSCSVVPLVAQQLTTGHICSKLWRQWLQHKLVPQKRYVSEFTFHPDRSNSADGPSMISFTFAKASDFRRCSESTTIQREGPRCAKENGAKRLPTKEEALPGMYH